MPPATRDARHYKPFWHMVAAAIRGHDGRIWTGMHLGATVGRMQICAEAIALGRAILEGDGTVDAASRCGTRSRTRICRNSPSCRPAARAGKC